MTSNRSTCCSDPYKYPSVIETYTKLVTNRGLVMPMVLFNEFLGLC